MIKYLLIDLDGTLLSFKKGERKAFIKTVEEFSNYILKEDDINLFSDINERLFNEYASGKWIRIEFQERRFREIFNVLGIDANASSANKFFINSLKYQADIYDDVLDTLKYLHSKYNLMIASNGMLNVQIKRLEIAGIYNLFDKCYVSEKINYNKPAKEFFDYIFNDLNDYNPSHYAIIGDRLETDILGGKNVGISTILVNRDNVKGNISPDFEVESFDELEKIL